ncbi:MAG: microtubule-binding protein [Pseudobdellovibrio sp.]|jgi:myosin heavy subunit|nr:microtubule-binding protein [Pseudobdellovibrio sp.]
MSFDYNRHKGHRNDESFWTSNSDLFLGLSSIFLILYVVASLRSGTEGVNAATENKKLRVQVQDLENQLKTYESVKEQYIQNQATKDEKTEYVELMDKLTMLQEEAKNEKDSLAKQAQEHAKKEMALNKYQQMVRNIINANNFAKTKISNRNEVIVEKEQVIDEKNQKITVLNKDINEKETQLRAQEGQIAQINTQLNDKLAELKRSYKNAKMTQKAYQARMKKLREEAESRLTQIEQEKNETYGQLENAKLTLRQAQSQLENTKGQLVQTQTELQQKGQEVASLNTKLNNAAAETQAKMNQLKGQFEAQKAADRAAFENALRQQKNLTKAEIGRREAAFKAEAEAKEKRLQGELAGLAGQLKATEGQLAQAKSEIAARKKIANEIKAGFAKMGIKADINGETGDVLLDFGESYFESNSANLTSDMRSVLQKAMPVYSKSLFGNENVADQISAVEIIGFASPTYKGKVIDPNSNRPLDREGLKYNMDLSYKRAKSIFNYILDNGEMDFEYRDTLVPNLKVSGRSFLDLMKQDRSIASVEDYCKKNDCKKSQRVIIRFSMDKKK